MAGLDDKAVFAALQSELNSRITARASINTAHVQTIVAFVAGFIAVRAAAPDVASVRGNLEFYGYYITAAMPIISLYFVLLYKHNDMQVGFLNLCLKRIEERSSSELPVNIRFYRKEGDYAETFEARKSSHRAVVGLCCVSPLLVVSDTALTSVFSSARTFSIASLSVFTFPFIVAVFTAVLSAINVGILVRLQRYRDDLKNRD